MASKKQKRFVKRNENKANSGIPESDEVFEDRMAEDELIERNQWTKNDWFRWFKQMRRKRF